VGNHCSLGRVESKPYDYQVRLRAHFSNTSLHHLQQSQPPESLILALQNLPKLQHLILPEIRADPNSELLISTIQKLKELQHFDLRNLKVADNDMLLQCCRAYRVKDMILGDWDLTVTALGIASVLQDPLSHFASLYDLSECDSSVLHLTSDTKLPKFTQGKKHSPAWWRSQSTRSILSGLCGGGDQYERSRFWLPLSHPDMGFWCAYARKLKAFALDAPWSPFKKVRRLKLPVQTELANFRRSQASAG